MRIRGVRLVNDLALRTAPPAAEPEANAYLQAAD
ncbi:hypothetical protein PAAM106076_16770 [Paracoccus aminovorans]|nr:hypothetical protein JCM7685_1374 [Paracoccus aminovorans]